MHTIQALFGHTEPSGGIARADCLFRERWAGRPGTAAPEDAFAAGNAACFGGALAFAGKKHRRPATRWLRSWPSN